MTAATKHRIRDIEGDLVADKNLHEELNDRFTKAESDVEYFRVADGILAYTAAESDARYGRIVLSSSTKVNNTGDTNKNEVFSGTVPANSIGIDGYFEFIVMVSATTSTTNIRTVFLNVNGTDIASVACSSTRSGQFKWKMFNAHSLTAQKMLGSATASYGWGVTSSAMQSLTFDTGAALTVKVYIQLAVGTEDMALELINVIAHP